MEHSLDMISSDIHSLSLLMDEWIILEIKKEFPEIKIHHLTYISAIGPIGISNVDLIIKVGKTKQAVNKVITNLRAHGLVVVNHYHSLKFIRINLTEHGEALFDSICSSRLKLQNIYSDILGINRYNHLLVALSRLKSFHKQ